MILINGASTDTFTRIVINNNYYLILINDSSTNSFIVSFNGSEDNYLEVKPNEVFNLENINKSVLYIKSKISGNSADFRLISY